MIGRLFTSLLNQTLDAQPQLASRLQGFAGRQVRIALPGFAATLAVNAEGRLQQAGREGAEAEIRIPLDALLEWQVDRLAARQRIQFDGDGEFVTLLADVLSLTHWDAEELLSRLVGDVAAHRILKVWRDRKEKTLDRWQRLSESVSDYMQFETRLVVARPEIEHFNQQVDILRYQLARLEQRLHLLESGDVLRQPASGAAEASCASPDETSL